MRWSFAAAILIALAGVASTCSVAAAQRVPEISKPPTVAPPVVTLPPPILNPHVLEPTPFIVTPGPVLQTPLTPAIQQPAIAAPGPPPQVCRYRTSSDCAQDAASCLAARQLTDAFAIEWRDGAPLVVRTESDTTDTQESGASDCATDLSRCLAGQC